MSHQCNLHNVNKIVLIDFTSKTNLNFLTCLILIIKTSEQLFYLYRQISRHRIRHNSEKINKQLRLLGNFQTYLLFCWKIQKSVFIATKSAAALCYRTNLFVFIAMVLVLSISDSNTQRPILTISVQTRGDGLGLTSPRHITFYYSAYIRLR